MATSPLNVRVRAGFRNAGVFHPETDWLDVPPEQYDDTMATNVRVPFFASQWVAKRLMAAGEGGSIVTTASLAGVIGNAAVEYGASKAAVSDAASFVTCTTIEVSGGA